MGDPIYEQFETHAINHWGLERSDGVDEYPAAGALLRRSAFRLYSADRWKTDRDWSVPRRKRPYSYLWILEEGGIDFCLAGGKAISLRERDFLIIPADSHYSAAPADKGETVCQVFHFDYLYLEGINLFTLCTIPFITGRLSEGKIEQTKELCRVFSHYQRDYGDWAATGLNYLLTPFFASALAKDGHHKTDRESKLRRLLPVLEYIRSNLTTSSLSLDELAQIASVSQVYLRRLFREVAGKSPVRYILEQKLVYARALLLGTDHTVSQIAAASGFESDTYFYRAFKKIYGCPPSCYRQNREM